MTAFILILLLAAADQGVKFFVDKLMPEGRTIPLIAGFFHITSVRNRGVAFGLMQGKAVLVTVITAAAIALMVLHLIKNRKAQSFWERGGFILITAGALGNLTDRLVRGYVVDMIDFRGIWVYVFNVADIWINLGVAFIIIDFLLDACRKKRKKSS